MFAVFSELFLLWSVCISASDFTLTLQGRPPGLNVGRRPTHGSPKWWSQGLSRVSPVKAAIEHSQHGHNDTYHYKQWTKHGGKHGNSHYDKASIDPDADIIWLFSCDGICMFGILVWDPRNTKQAYRGMWDKCPVHSSTVICRHINNP